MLFWKLTSECSANLFVKLGLSYHSLSLTLSKRNTVRFMLNLMLYLLSGSGAIIKSSSTRWPAPSQTATALAIPTASEQQWHRPQQHHKYQQQQNIGCSNGRNSFNIAAAAATRSSRKSNSRRSGYSNIRSSRTALSAAAEQHYQQQQLLQHK